MPKAAADRDSPRSPMAVMTAMVLLTIAVLAALAWQGLLLGKQYDTAIARSLRLTALAGRIEQIDQALTLTANLAVTSTDPVWAQRHSALVVELQNVLQQTAKASGDGEIQQDAEGISSTNRAIMRLEAQAIRLATSGQAAQAHAILAGPTYHRLEADYAAGVKALLGTMDRLVDATLAASRRLAAWMAGTLLAASVGLGASWIVVRRLIGRYQRERQETANVLRYSYERMEAILSSMAEGVLLIDRSGHVVMANRSAARLLGDAPGSKVGDLLPPTTPTPGQDIRLESLDEHGHQQVLRVNRTPLRPLGWVVTFRDATAEEASQRARSEFVSLASHELRTPITIVSGYVELLLQAEAIGLGHEKQDQILHCIQNQSRRLARIVDDLLKVSRMDAGRMAIRPAAVQAATVVDEVVETLALQAEAKGMIIDRDVPAEPLPPVFADADLVVEVLTNLIDNAIKYSPPHTHITVSLATSGRFARLGVSDTGPGIAPEEQSRIFDRFYRVASPETLRERGTGLGLAISRQLTELQGGSLVVCSQSGQGATFCH